jgi:hypothetical protein
MKITLQLSCRNPRGIDGMLLTKYDTVDDKAGTQRVNMSTVLYFTTAELSSADQNSGWCSLVHGLRDRLGVDGCNLLM